MDSTELYQFILGLRSPWTVTHVEMRAAQEEIHVFVEHATGSQFCCPACSRQLPVYDHTSERTWRHLDTCQLKTFLHAKPPRVQCPDHKTRQPILPWAEPGSNFTALFERLAIDFLQSMSATGSQGILRVSAEQLYGIKSRAVLRGLARRESDKKAGTHPVLQHGCVDEKSWKKGRQFGTILCNAGKGFVEEVYEGRAGDGLADFYDGLSEKAKSQIESMSQDFHAGYSSVTLAKLEHGRKVVVFDRFHLMMHVNEALASTHRKEVAQTRRIIEQGGLKSAKSAAGHAAVAAHFRLKEIVDAKWALLCGSDSRTDKQQAQTSWAAEGHYESAEAWRFKETLRSMWLCETVEQAEQWLKDWCIKVRDSSVKAMHKVAKMAQKHAWGILNGFRMKISNSPAETMNSKIQSIRCKARGHSNFAAFKNDVLFHLGGLSLYPKMLTD
jgi:transposase